MADETEDTTANEEHVDQPDDEQVDLPDELPEDPVELRKIAAAAISRLQTATQREEAAKNERERLEDNLEEQRTKANFWSVKAQELEANAKSKPTPKEKPDPKDDGLDDDTELAVAVTEGMTLRDFDARAERIARRVANQTADELSKQGQIGRALTGEYPDLNNQDSPLTKATIAEMGKIDSEMPGLADGAKFELATRRAATKLGVAAKTNGNGESKGDASKQKERERLRTAQGGPTGKASPGKGAIVITEADRAEARKMNGGQDVPDNVLKNAKKFQQERESYREQGRA